MKILSFLFPLLCWANSICMFTPPKGWEAAQPKDLSEHVQIGFVGKGSTEFRPSINLATEEIDCTLKEYVKAVKEIHLSQPKTKWKNLGKIEMKSGPGVLTEIISPSPFGNVHMLQALFVHESRAYILTAAVLKQDFVPLQKELLQSLASLEMSNDLISVVRQEELKLQFQTLFTSLGQFATPENREIEQADQWKSLQQFVMKKGDEMGGYWQFLALKEGYLKIYPPRKS
jgi:hypothetical protein